MDPDLVPIQALPAPSLAQRKGLSLTRVLNALRGAGIVTVGAVLASDATELLEIPGIGVAGLSSLASALLYFGEHPQESRLNLLTVLDTLALGNRAWGVLDGRFGLGRRLSLEGTARTLALNVTRERIRQIQAGAIGRLAAHRVRLAPALDPIEDDLCVSHAQPDEIWSADSLIEEWASLLIRRGWQGVSTAGVSRLLLALRSLAAGGRLGRAGSWPLLSFKACALVPAIERHPAVADALSRLRLADSEARRTWTYEELAETVLREEGAPLHWSEAAERAERLGHRSNFSSPAFFNALQGAHSKFARTSAGTYGLSEWGITSVGSYPDIIAEVLRDAGRPLTYGVLDARVSRKRPIKKASLMMFLTMHPRFYESLEGSYGLRAWLPPRDQQTLRTPKWKVEDTDSVARVERALERGYDVDAIVARDKAAQDG